MKFLLRGSPILLPQWRHLRGLATAPINESTGLSYYHNPDPLPLVYRTIGQQLELAARKYPNTGAVISHHEDKTITFPEVLDRADKLAASLANMGIERGDRIGIWMPTQLNWYVAMMAIARLGGISVALNPAYQAPEIEYCIKKAGIKAMFIADTYKTQDYYKMLTKVIPEIETGGSKIESKDYPLERIIIDSNKKLNGSFMIDELLKPPESNITEIRKLQDRIQPDDPCNIQFTSGTTGKPKAALLSHYNFVNNGRHIGYRFEFDKMPHRICLNTPFFHAYGVVIGVMAALAHGASLYLPNPGFSAADAVTCIQKYKLTYLYGTPTMHLDVVEHLKKTGETLDSLRFASTGGSPISPKLLLEMQKYLGVERVRSIFGMTETSAVIFQSIPLENRERVLDFVGKVQDQMEAKVVDANGDIVPYGVPGELWVRGYNTMLGYYGDEEKTREMIGRDKWLKTGDQFVLHEDGFGKIVGRLKEMIIRGGENIFPKEIEDFLNTHPDVQETYVAGVADERLGEEVAAFIKMKAEKEPITQEAIKKFCTGKIAHFKIPAFVQVVREFPKTTSGKIQKFKLVEEFEKTRKAGSAS